MKNQPCKTSKKAIKSSYGYKKKSNYARNRAPWGTRDYDVLMTPELVTRLENVINHSFTIDLDPYHLNIIKSVLSNYNEHKDEYEKNYISQKQLSIIENSESFIEYCLFSKKESNS